MRVWLRCAVLFERPQDARLEPKPEAAEDDDREGDKLREPGRTWNVRDGTVEKTENGNAEDEMERADQYAFARCVHWRTSRFAALFDDN